jgi:hypothetical protein
MDPGWILIIGLVVLGLLAGGLTIVIGMVRNPPRAPQWRPNPHPGRGPYWDQGRTWADLLARAALVALGTMFFIVPGALLLSMGSSVRAVTR